MLMLWAAFGEQYALNHKVTFDGVQKKIYISTNVTSLSVKNDLYSSWKEWLLLADNSKYEPAFRTIGGDSVGAGKYAGDIYFLLNGWKIVVGHKVDIEGTLYHDDNVSPYEILAGGGVIATVSNLAYALESAAAGLTPAQQVQLDKILQAVRTAIALSA